MHQRKGLNFTSAFRHRRQHSADNGCGCNNFGDITSALLPRQSYICLLPSGDSVERHSTEPCTVKPITPAPVTTHKTTERKDELLVMVTNINTWLVSGGYVQNLGPPKFKVVWTASSGQHSSPCVGTTGLMTAIRSNDQRGHCSAGGGNGEAVLLSIGGSTEICTHERMYLKSENPAIE
ncbi:hypothetical protein ON010_g18869 [Phytophthora cinnamomi]|nr:hypothetical protein ON010_g18869 [Phytophthora cinnamomi]